MKKNIKLIIVGILVFIVCIIVIIFFTTDLFKSNQNLFWKYGKEATKLIQQNININNLATNKRFEFILTEYESNSIERIPIQLIR